jgi:hypothetical protein
VKLFDKEREKIKEEIRAKAIDMAVIAFEKIVERSPIWYGDYILSHRFSVGAPSMEPPSTRRELWLATLSDEEKNRNIERIPPEASIEEKAAFRVQVLTQLAKRYQAKAFQDIYITNESPSALFVETLGTPRAPQGHHVYGLTVEEIKNRFK